ncbi:MAG TPA: hypothetical protein DHV65_13695, partial [Ktedonobacter sp.]|nr:hypothetical protein [Ktedonobacter sp.]
MTQRMAEQQELLTRLVEETYDCRGAVLQPISPYLLEDRGIYRVDWEDGTSSVPVSYTHLRAHETRHDIVCRLLL